MRRLAEELHVEQAMRERQARCPVSRAGMRHDGGINALERPAFDQPHLAAATALLRRAAEHDHGALAPVERLLQRDAHAHAERGDQVVPAGVSERRQRVVLAEHRDRGRSRASDSLECRLNPVGGTDDLEPLVLQDAGKQRMGLTLLVPQLGVRVNLAADAPQFVRTRVDGIQGALLFRCVVGHRGASRNVS